MDKRLHHFGSIGNQCCLVFTRESSLQGFLGGAKWISFIHIMVQTGQERGAKRPSLHLSPGILQVQASSWAPNLSTFSDLGLSQQGSSKDTCCTFETWQNKGKPPFTRQCSGVFHVRIPVLRFGSVSIFSAWEREWSWEQEE